MNARAVSRPAYAAVALLLLVGHACFIFGHKPEGRPAVDLGEGEVALRVVNHTTLDVVVYLVHDGVRTRVGTVTASSSTAFFLSVRSLGQGREIRLFGDPIGGRDHAETEQIIVQPGQQIEWTLEQELRRSAVAVY
jgi:hypothetical protein